MRKYSNLAPILLLILIFPVVGLFCWHLGGSDGQKDPSALQSEGEVPLVPRQGLKTLPSGLSHSPGMPQEARIHASRIHGFDNPFRTGLTRAMVMAQGDPFVESLVSGISGGDLVLQSTPGIPTYGPPRPTPRTARFSDREIMQAMQLRVGGAFSNFFENVFEPEDGRTKETARGDDLSEENPFLKAIELLAERRTQAEPAATDDGAAPPEADDGDTAQSTPEQNAPAPGVVMPRRPVTTDRPHLILRIGEDGSFNSASASQPRPGRFETVEMGIRDFALLPFSDSADLTIALAVADFNQDGSLDVCVKVGLQDTLRFFYGSKDGKYRETKRVTVGRGPRSIAAGDFNRDGLMDVAVSAVGNGILTFLWGSSSERNRFTAFWSDAYRDYITAADVSAGGHVDLVGVNFANRAEVLVDFSDPEGATSETKFTYQPSLDSQVATIDRRQSRINAVVLASSLSLNLENRQGQLTNVLNVSSGSDVYVIVGDIENTGRLTVGIATPKPE